jgi:hypothetical protein
VRNGVAVGEPGKTPLPSLERWAYEGDQIWTCLVEITIGQPSVLYRVRRSERPGASPGSFIAEWGTEGSLWFPIGAGDIDDAWYYCNEHSTGNLKTPEGRDV